MVSKINDYTLDDMDFLIFLTVGKEPCESPRVHRMVFLLSKILNMQTDFIVYKNGVYSETLAERLNSNSKMQLLTKSGKKFMLTDEGKEIYKEILEKLKEDKDKDDTQLVEILNELYKIPTEGLTKMINFLYFDGTFSDKNDKEKFNDRFKVERNGNDIIIDLS